MYNVALHDLLSSLIIISVAKSRKKIWAGHVVFIDEMTNAQRIMLHPSILLHTLHLCTCHCLRATHTKF
jgi:hypothetical protein